MNRIVLSGHITFPEADLAQVREALPEHIAATLEEEGCLVFRVEEQSSHPGRFDVYEEFVSRAAFEIHQERARDSNWGQASQNGQRVYSIQERE